jgi:hypothetical protein
MFRLRDLLWVDEQFSDSIAVSDCFGDRFLCGRNRVFRGLRKMFLDAGGSYREANAFDLGRRYLVAPLLCLEEILTTSTVPYRSNRAAVQALVDRNPQLELLGPSLSSLVTPNYLMHETAHWLSYAVSHGHAGEGLVAEAICSEAFANTVERLALIDVKSPADGVFVVMNSYANHLRIAPVLRTAIAEFGFVQLFSIAMVCYACANISAERPSVDLVVDFLRTSRLLHKIDEPFITTLVNDVFTLRGAFREETSLVYFRLLGLEESFKSIRSLPLNGEPIARLGLRRSVELHLERVSALFECSQES